MTTLKMQNNETLNHNNLENLENTELFLNKKEPTLSFKNFYQSHSLSLSHYKLKNPQEKIKKFKNLTANLSKLFLPRDKFAADKKEIDLVMSNLLNQKKYKEANEFLQHGLILNSGLRNNFITNFKSGDVENHLMPIQIHQPLYGILGQKLFTSSHFQIYCGKILQVFAENFGQEYLSPDIMNNFKSSNFKYKEVNFKEVMYDKDHGLQAIHMHNTCLNPHFSFPLFCDALQALFENDKFEYMSLEWRIGSVVKNLFPYIKHSLTNEDKQFLFDTLESNRDRLFKKGAAQMIQDIVSQLIESVKAEMQSVNANAYKESILNKVKKIYGKEEHVQHHFLPLYIENNQFLSEHTHLIDNIKSIHQKLSGQESLLDSQDIDTVNNLISQTLPTTIDKYSNIDPHFRTSIKNIEGKNAHQLFEESLTNILFVMKDVEINLEQTKINDLSLVNRKNRIK